MGEEEKVQEEKPSTVKSSNTGMAAICYLGILVLIPLLTEAKKDPFVNFHIKQGLVLLIAYVIGGFLFWVPVIGWILGIILFILFIMGLINALGGKQTPLPVIGKFGNSFKI